MQVQLINFAGLDEAGIDGGGLFREFIAELLKTAFDPNRGFFKISNDNLLYPNPAALKLVENFTTHYFFLGRILAKVCFKNHLNKDVLSLDSQTLNFANVDNYRWGGGAQVVK